jgi:iron complex outermembrane recepter protein
MSVARAEDAGHPQLWIELGGQLQSLENSDEKLDPPFLASVSNPDLLRPLDVQRPAIYALDEEAKISFQPDGSDWVFAAAIKYGRSHISRDHHHQTPNANIYISLKVPPQYTAFKGFNKYYTAYPNGHLKFADGKFDQNERHTILDFQAGKDVGLGILGSGAISTISAGVRIANLRSRSNTDLRAEPDVQYPTAPIIGTFFSKFSSFVSLFRNAHPHFHDYHGTLARRQSFNGIGPSLSWDASVPFAGNSESGELTLDFGANAAALFGRQKTRGQQKIEALGYYGSAFYQQGAGGKFRPGRWINLSHDTAHTNNDGYVKTLYAHTTPIDRSRSVVVPNFGGFAGISFLYSDAKVSFGYRADFFFGAMDGGIATRKSENRGFFGPFASISVGLGD